MRKLLVISIAILAAAVAFSAESKASPSGQAAPTTATAPAAAIIHDLSGPEYSPPDTPEWMKEKLPDWVQPYLGKNGLVHPWRNVPGPMGKSSKGLDRYQANHFLFYRPETAKYLYTEYTPLKVDYKPGTLPTFEAAAAKYTAGCTTDTEKAVALLTKALPAVLRHPTVPPLYPDRVPADRALDDEALLASGKGWCNEQARVFVRLCQVSGIPARIVQMFWSNQKSGHTMSEFYADGRWAMADSSNFIVFPGPDGKLLSVEQCHDRGEGQKYAGIAYVQRYKEQAQLPDAELARGGNHEAAEKKRQGLLAVTPEEAAAHLGTFGFNNYPLSK